MEKYQTIISQQNAISALQINPIFHEMANALKAFPMPNLQIKRSSSD